MAAKPSFVPEAFAPPTLVETAGFKLVPLGPALVEIDFDAYMSSIEHLQQTFTRSTGWPREGITDADAMRDMETEQARFQEPRIPSPTPCSPPTAAASVAASTSIRASVAGYDAEITMWVTKAEYDAGFDAELYAVGYAAGRKGLAVRDRSSYPGRAIAWDACGDALVAANGTATPCGRKRRRRNWTRHPLGGRKSRSFGVRGSLP